MAGGRVGPPGAIVCVAAVLLFALLAWAALYGAAVPQLDREIAAWLSAHAAPSLKQAMRVVSDLHAPRGILVMTVVVATALLWRRDIGGMATVLITVLGGATLNHFLKHGFQRARPGMDPALAAVTDFSFPSGHVANSTLLYGVVAAWVVGHMQTPAAKASAVLAATALVSLVAASRMVLGAHYLSDVLAGALVGLAWLSLCLAPFRRGH